MTKTREKKVVVSGVTREQMEDAFGKFALADARHQETSAKMDAEITRIRDRYADDLAELQKKKEEAFDVLQTYAVENRADLFSKKKSMETTHGILGFRTGTPKLKTRKGFTWAAILELLREFAPGYVRTTEEPAKDKLLADRDLEGMPALMEKAGIVVDQDETFFVEPKKEKE